jgi:hypothetical protein
VTEGRWAGGSLRTRDDYYPVKKVAEFSFDDLPTNDEFVAKLERDNDA